ncbi:Peptidase M50B-like [Kytococcus aerolatus]|uniref:Peptidase M50B-like n=1 Tax=Kytococcus aerolatus TaxID=592308 RepID=A0A212TEV7_9MICO|nr:M50 family metallopeptidase [Kytococcus aerolatus]SNC64361.1 Peptidase M50B-like [Kytococcus aerolatus]
MIDELWIRVSATQPPLHPLASVLVAVLALAATWSPLGHHLLRHAVTVVHEAGHALVALLVGRRLTGIHLHRDTSGVTVSRGRARGPGMVATLLAGYPAPALLGLIGSWVVGTGHAAAWLWGFVALCVVMLLLVRNLYGAWVVLALGAVVGALSWWSTGPLLTAAAQLTVWGLLLAAPRAVLDLQRGRVRVRRRGHRDTSDAGQLADQTGVPGIAWTVLFALVCLGCLGVALWALVGESGLRP